MKDEKERAGLRQTQTGPFESGVMERYSCYFVKVMVISCAKSLLILSGFSSA